MAVGIICVVLIVIGVFAIKHYAWKLVRGCGGNDGEKGEKLHQKGNLCFAEASKEQGGCVSWQRHRFWP